MPVIAFFLFITTLLCGNNGYGFELSLCVCLSLSLSLSHTHSLSLSLTHTHLPSKLVIVIFLYCLCSYSLRKPGKHLENEVHQPNLTDAQYKAKMCVALGNRSKVSVVEFSLAFESDSRGCLKLLLF